MTSWFVFNSDTERFPKSANSSRVKTTKAVRVLKTPKQKQSKQAGREIETAEERTKGRKNRQSREEEETVRVAVTNTVYFTAHVLMAVWSNHEKGIDKKERNKIEQLIKRFSGIQTKLCMVPENVKRDKIMLAFQ